MCSRAPGQPLNRHAMSVALRGTKHEKCKGKTKTAGLCELLGLAKFTPHDLRRTAATLAGRPRIPRSHRHCSGACRSISPCGDRRLRSG
jgi:integrase